MILKPWMPAVEAQLSAYKLASLLVKNDKRSELQSGWQIDRALLTTATPYMWSTETMNAVLEASKSIPLDTPLNKWNLESERSWWWFETPLPFETITVRESSGIRALAFGFLQVKDAWGGGHADELMQELGVSNAMGYAKFGMPIVCWIDAKHEDFEDSRFPLAPSQVFEWDDGMTLGSMLETTRSHHAALYGPGGKWSHRPQLGLERYMDATEGVARFLLAALAWLKQRVVVTDDGQVERHRRKEIAKAMQREMPTVRVVSLRKAERQLGDPHPDTATDRTYHVRWVVGGHWRNQPCGPKHGDRRLTYIMPFMKGPDDMPLKAAARKVYTVDR